MPLTVTKLDRHGRVVIPAEHRRALCLEEGDAVVVQLEGAELRILKQEEAIKRVQKMVRKYTGGQRSLVDELIAERRAEAARE